MKILLTGGSGLLGKEIQKYITCYAPSHKELDITKKIKVDKTIDMVIHCAAYTDVARSEVDRKQCALVNIKGTYNLLKAFPNAKFVYISTEYVYRPVNFYSHTKLVSEHLVKAKTNQYLIIRTLFKANPFPYKVAFFDQYTKGDYVDVIAPLIAAEIFKDFFGRTVDVGTGRKSIFSLARRTKPYILACSVDDVQGVTLPKDYE